MNILTVINWTNDSLDVIRAKQQLADHLEENKTINGNVFPKAKEYSDRRVSELTDFIKNHSISDSLG